MEDILGYVTLLLGMALIILVTIQPRQQQIFSSDATSNIGKPNYWRSNTGVKVATLVVSILLFLFLLLFMMIGL